jgi:hypothetical protein
VDQAHEIQSLADDTKQVCQFVGTPSAKWCSKINFPHKGDLGYNIKLSENSQKSSFRSRQTTCKTSSLSCVPNSTEWLSSTRFQNKYNKIKKIEK